MSLSLSKLEFNLPEWQEQDFVTIHNLEKKVKIIANGGGSNSDRFLQACSKLKTHFDSTPPLDHSVAFKELVDIRALTYLLTSSKDFAENISIDKALLQQLQSIKDPLSKLSLTQLIRTYFLYFDQITDEAGLVFWAAFIKKQLIVNDLKFGSNELKKYSDNRKLIFEIDSPSKLAKKARAEKVDLDLYVKRLGLDGYSNGRFITKLKHEYYLQQLQSLPLGEDDPILSEVVKPDVYSSPHEDRALGHSILEIIIDRSAGKKLSARWQSVILSIAGDPRVPNSHRSYQRWWTILGEKRIALVSGWLSSFDLSLFLKVLEQSAKDGENQDMQRMFKPRKAFIEGLESLGLIAHSRLFLSSDAVRYLHKHYKQEELPSYARATSNETSMIYININNKVHMIEGSHSFRLKLMNEIPSRCNVINYNRNSITNNELRGEVVQQYHREFDNEHGIIEVTHDQHLNWQYKAISFLKSRMLKVNASDVIEKDRQREFKQKFGAL